MISCARLALSIPAHLRCSISIIELDGGVRAHTISFGAIVFARCRVLSRVGFDFKMTYTQIGELELPFLRLLRSVAYNKNIFGLYILMPTGNSH